MNIRKHKQAYLGTVLVVISIAILWLLIAVTSSKTIQTDETLKSGIGGSAIKVRCANAKACSSEYVQAMIAITDTDGKSAKLETKVDGQFTVKLAPGTYTANATDAKNQKSFAPSQQVTVRKDAITKITFNF